MPEDQPRDRGIRPAAAVVGGLFVLVLAANVLWPGPPPFSSDQPRMSQSQSPFPVFRLGPSLEVVRLEAGTNQSTRLLWTSLQGLVNRVQVELYLDVAGVSGNTSSMLAFLAARYNVTYNVLAPDVALDVFAPRALGLVVYDPERPESVNVATMIAANRTAAIVGPDLSEWMHLHYGLPILFDYASSNWATLDSMAVTGRSLGELYPSSNPTLLSILPPDRWAIRDYLIATKTFVFYEPQGALASPLETTATMRVLHATPRGIPILGWFSSPTLTEENSFVQMASREGKFVVGAQDVPNLSVLTALGRNEVHRQVSSAYVPTPVLANKTYVVVAIPDGDNLDFVAGRMRELWTEPERGTTPIAWSANPLLVDLAPPLLDLYYDNATSLDRFIASPSGAGYLYPDYTGPGDLSRYLAFSNRYMNAADMDVVWLLNAFTASEIPYAPTTLAAYADGIRPVGIVLDYDDQPRTQGAWVAAGAVAAAPVVRSTHFWTTADNVFGKLGSVMAAWDAGPHFLWLTVYTFRYDLRDAVALLANLSARMDGNLEVVTPTAFFSLLRQDFVREAEASFAAMARDPVATTLFASSFDSARSSLVAAQALLAVGDSDRAAYDSFQTSEILQGIARGESLLASLIVLLVAGVVAFVAQRTSNRLAPRSEPIELGPFIIVTASVALLVFALREALEQNFWTYPSILLGVAIAGVYRPLRRVLDRSYPERAPVVAALLALVFVALSIRTSSAFPLAMLGILLAIEGYLSRRPATPPTLLAGLTVGTAIGFIGGFDLPTFTALAVLLVVPAIVLPASAVPSDETVRPARAWLPGFALALPLTAISIAFSYSLSVRLDLQGDALPLHAASVLILGPTLAIVADRVRPTISPSRGRLASLGLAVACAGVVLTSRGTVLVTLGLLALVATLAYAALAGLREFASGGGESRRALAVAIGFLPLFVLFFRMPPIVYSLTLVRLPESIEYALYTSPVLIAVTALVVAVAGWLGPRRSSVGKDYPGESYRGAGGP